MVSGVRLKAMACDLRVTKKEAIQLAKLCLTVSVILIVNEHTTVCSQGTMRLIFNDRKFQSSALRSALRNFNEIHFSRLSFNSFSHFCYRVGCVRSRRFSFFPDTRVTKLKEERYLRSLLVIISLLGGYIALCLSRRNSSNFTGMSL